MEVQTDPKQISMQIQTDPPVKSIEQQTSRNQSAMASQEQLKEVRDTLKLNLQEEVTGQDIKVFDKSNQNIKL